MTFRVSMATTDGTLLSLVSFQYEEDARKYVEQLKQECIKTETYNAIEMWEM